jgi:hypothetical protein
VRGRNTNGMAEFSAFFPGEYVERPPVTSVRFVDSDAAAYPTDKTISRLCDRNVTWITERRMCMKFPFVGESHKLNVRLAGLRGPYSGIKSSWLSWARILPISIANGAESINAGCVRGPPC